MKHVLAVILVLWSCAVQAAVQMRVECPEVIGVGLPFLVQVESDRPMDGVRVEWGDKKFNVPAHNATSVEFLLGTDVLKSERGHHVLRVVRLGLSPISVESTILVEKREFPEQRLTVAEEMVTPSPAAQERIQKENLLVRKILGTVTSVNHLVLPLIRPVPGEVTSLYGLTRFFNDQPRNPHRGLDLRAAQGDPVQAAAPGKVVLAADHYYAGRCVFVDHGLGVHTQYMHLDEILVREGDMVEAGQILGRAGKTGRVTAAHLHFGLSILDLAVDPTPLFFQPTVQ